MITLSRFSFHFADRHGRARALALDSPTEVVTARELSEVLPALRRVQQAQQERGCYAAGYIAYEAAPAFDAGMQTHARYADEPLVYFALFDVPGHASAESQSGTGVGVADAAPAGRGSFHMSPWQMATARDDYDQRIAEIRAAIAAGRSYQVNHTIALHSEMQADASGVRAYYHAMRQAQKADWCAHLDMGAQQILSASPELLFAFAPCIAPCTGAASDSGTASDSTVITRPMKGTRPRGLWAQQDLALRDSLRQSDKDRAENLMITDLLRNDLGRIARTGSVRVEKLFALEAYPSVWQMTSTISAQLAPQRTWLDVLQVLFPCGSVTGAPKLEAMRIIKGCEVQPRGVYCGSIGLIEPDGYAAFNVAIRTLSLSRDKKPSRWRARYHTGSGITWPSEAAAEYAEAMDKVRFLPAYRPADGAPAQNAFDKGVQMEQAVWHGGNSFQILETLLHDGTCFTLLSRHLRRMRQSAARFGYPFDRRQALHALHQLKLPVGEARHRVRLLLYMDGRIEASATPLSHKADTAGAPKAVLLANQPIDSNCLWLYHKTTNRRIYDMARRQLDGTEAFDVLLYNHQGELCEFTIGNLVMEIDGAHCTPPVASGLLPGTLRAQLLDAGEIAERVLTLEDLRIADRLWLINSVRGWVEVKLDTLP